MFILFSKQDFFSLGFRKHVLGMNMIIFLSIFLCMHFVGRRRVYMFFIIIYRIQAFISSITVIALFKNDRYFLWLLEIKKKNKAVIITIEYHYL